MSSVAQSIGIPVQSIAALRAGDIEAFRASMPELALAFEALFRAVTSRNGTDAVVGDRFHDADIGTRGGDGRFNVDRSIVWPGENGKEIENDPDGPVTVWRTANFMHVEGCGFGGGFSAGDGLLTWIGPNLSDYGDCRTGNAYYYMAEIGGSIIEGGSGAAGLNFSDSSSATGTGHTVTIIHADDGPPPTMGGNALGSGIVVSWSYTWSATAVLTSGIPSPGAISAVLTLNRTKGGGAAGSVSATTGSLSASGERTVEPNLGGGYLIVEYMTTTGTYEDPTADIDPRTFALTLTSRTGTVLSGTQSLNVSSNEEV